MLWHMPSEKQPPPFVSLETPRLTLRRITLDDTDAIFDLFSDDRVTPFMDIETLTEREQAAATIREFEEMYTSRSGIRWGIVRKENDRLIGTCGYHAWFADRDHRAELGCDLLPGHWGCDLMPEALRIVIPFGFETMNLNRIEAMVLPGHERSMALLRKLGFQHEGLLRQHGRWKGRFWDEHCFSLLHEQWEGSD